MNRFEMFAMLSDPRMDLSFWPQSQTDDHTVSLLIAGCELSGFEIICPSDVQPAVEHALYLLSEEIISQPQWALLSVEVLKDLDAQMDEINARLTDLSMRN